MRAVVCQRFFSITLFLNAANASGDPRWPLRGISRANSELVAHWRQRRTHHGFRNDILNFFIFIFFFPERLFSSLHYWFWKHHLYVCVCSDLSVSSLEFVCLILREEAQILDLDQINKRKLSHSLLHKGNCVFVFLERCLNGKSIRDRDTH